MTICLRIGDLGFQYLGCHVQHHLHLLCNRCSLLDTAGDLRHRQKMLYCMSQLWREDRGDHVLQQENDFSEIAFQKVVLIANGISEQFCTFE